MTRLLSRFAAFFWLPFLLLSAYAICRVMQVNIKTDLDGISAVLRIAFIAGAGAIAYFVYVASHFEPLEGTGRVRRGFWAALSLFFCGLVADDSFMIHETIGYHTGIHDAIPLAAYFGLLGLIMLLNLRHFTGRFWFFFSVFFALSVIAVIGDTSENHEGTVHIGSFEFDYEMFAETLAMLSLAAAVTAQAVHELFRALRAAPAQPSASVASSTAAAPLSHSL